MAEKGILNAYQLMQRSDGQLSQTKAYHLVRTRGDVVRLDLDTIAGLLVAFGLPVERAGELFGPVPDRGPAKKAAKGKGKD